MATLHPIVTAEDVIRELGDVYDPELGIDIVSLGLVYEAAVDQSTVYVRMTLTTPECPVGPMILADARQVLERLPMIDTVDVDLVWDPPWDLSMMSDEAKEQFGLV